MLPSASRDLNLPGFSIGHGSDLAHHTGVTVIFAPDGAVTAAEVRGSATGTRQFDSILLAHHVASRAHAVVLSGGSGGGLSSADPVVDHLAARGHGFRTGYGIVPIVPTAILFDLGFGQPVRPQRTTVEQAIASAATGRVPTGSVGAGTGATCGKAKGLDHAMKGGFGFASLTVPGGPTVAAAVAVNAFGDVRDPDTARLLAGCRTAPDALALAGAEHVLAALPSDAAHPWEGNTTLAVVMTDADLPKPVLFKVAQMAFGGFYRALSPALTVVDGDLVVVMSTAQTRAHPNQVGVLAERAVALAIVEAVVSADGFGLIPASRDLAAAR